LSTRFWLLEISDVLQHTKNRQNRAVDIAALIGLQPEVTHRAVDAGAALQRMDGRRRMGGFDPFDKLLAIDAIEVVGEFPERQVLGGIRQAEDVAQRDRKLDFPRAHVPAPVRQPGELLGLHQRAHGAELGGHVGDDEEVAGLAGEDLHLQFLLLRADRHRDAFAEAFARALQRCQP
jgi:hypothetical protein